MDRKKKKSRLKVCIVKRLAGRESVNPHGAEGWIGKLLMFRFLKKRKRLIRVKAGCGISGDTTQRLAHGTRKPSAHPDSHLPAGTLTPD